MHTGRRELEVLLEFSRAANAAVTVDAVLSEIAKAVREGFGFDRVREPQLPLERRHHIPTTAIPAFLGDTPVALQWPIHMCKTPADAPWRGQGHSSRAAALDHSEPRCEQLFASGWARRFLNGAKNIVVPVCRENPAASRVVVAKHLK